MRVTAGPLHPEVRRENGCTCRVRIRALRFEVHDDGFSKKWSFLECPEVIYLEPQRTDNVALFGSGLKNLPGLEY